MGGPVPPGYSGITIGSLISVRRHLADDPRLLRHEFEHVQQWRSHGPIGFLRQYLGSYLRSRLDGYSHDDAYHRIPFEVEAERAAARAGDGPGTDGADPVS
ncbi:MAG: hypothetical protein M3159_07780 [Actinomycetota bacterium]|nr:hypothetical protein [Actinomycetota bacterium]